jgi:hypothetical protein
MTELLCSRDLALRPETMAYHREMKNTGHLLVSDLKTSWPMFWVWQLSREQMLAARSSE